MSKTYKKVLKLGFCCGSNTEWYRRRARSQRAKNRQILRGIRKMNIEDFNNTCEFIKLPKNDSWCEPTDGTWLVDEAAIRKWIRYINGNDEYDARWAKRMYKKFAHQIKSYHTKNIR